MSEHSPGDPKPPDSLGSPDPDRSGPTFDDSVDTAEAGSQVEGVHTPSGQATPGDSRVEQMPDVDGITDGRVDGDPDATASDLEPGPSPAGVGSGGAQRVVGARISDRVSAGEAVPEGPPFDTDAEGTPQDPGAGN